MHIYVRIIKYYLGLWIRMTIFAVMGIVYTLQDKK